MRQNLFGGGVLWEDVAIMELTPDEITARRERIKREWDALETADEQAFFGNFN